MNQSTEKQLVFAAPISLGWRQAEPDGSLLRHLVAADAWARFLRHRQELAGSGACTDGFSETVIKEASSELLPQEVVQRDAAAFASLRDQLGLLGDSAPPDTSAREYYRITQWIFLQLLARRLVKRERRTVDVCTKCHSTFPLSRIDACRTGAGTFETREVTRWYLNTETYGDRLSSDVDKSEWPASARAAQRDLLERRRGVEVTFAVSRPFEAEYSELTVFTTQIEAIYGATFLALDPFHPALEDLIDSAYADDVARYRERLRQGLEPRLSAVRTGGFALNPVSLVRIPIVLTPLANTAYSDGAVMAVPGHDENFFVLAQRFRLRIREVIHNDKAKFDSSSRLVEPWIGDGVLTNSAQFTSLHRKIGRDRIISFLSRRGICRRVTRYRFRRLAISGSYQWGAPVPVIHCDRCGPVGVPESDLPLELPEITRSGFRAEPAQVDYAPAALQAACPSCGEIGERDRQTLQPWLGRAWAFLRVLLPHLAGELSGFRPLQPGRAGDVETGAASEGRGLSGSEPASPASGADVAVASAPASGGAAAPASREMSPPAEAGEMPPQGEASEMSPPAEAGEMSPPAEAGEMSPPAEASEMPPPTEAAAAAPPAQPQSPPDATGGPDERGPDQAAETPSEAGDTLVAVEAGPAREQPAPLASGRSAKRGRPSRQASRPVSGGRPEPQSLRPFRAGGNATSSLPGVSTFGAPTQTSKELLGTRFVTKFLYDLGECPFYEPFRRFAAVGPVRLADASEPSTVEATRGVAAICASAQTQLAGSPVWRQWIGRYGADAVRLHLLFLGALDRSVVASEAGIEQMRRLLDRIRHQVALRKEKGKFVSQRMLTQKHLLIHTLTQRLESWSFHTAVAAILRFVRFLGSAETSVEEMDSSALETFVVLLSPFAPDLAAELWAVMGRESAIDDEAWPVASEELVHPPEREFLVLVNGRIRDRMQQPVDTKAEKLESWALQREPIREIVGHRRISKVIVVPQRLVSIVLEDAVEEEPPDAAG